MLFLCSGRRIMLVRNQVIDPQNSSQFNASLVRGLPRALRLLEVFPLHRLHAKWCKSAGKNPEMKEDFNRARACAPSRDWPTATCGLAIRLEGVEVVHPLKIHTKQCSGGRSNQVGMAAFVCLLLTCQLAH